MWMQSPMPMVTLTKTLDVTALVKFSKKHGVKLNMLLCWCIGKTAAGMDEFYILPEKGGLFRYDKLSINVIVPNVIGGILMNFNNCAIYRISTNCILPIHFSG